ncbi:MAG: MBL fold metallo-hydrolase [Alphaproteobacteria bacterium]|nr:MBL fold metallo-hydrolase [Alphaproteobacteria bacterium]
MNKVIILGAGAAPGVPSINSGWGACNPDNPKNYRTRTSTFIEMNGVTILIDTNPDINRQLTHHQINRFDALLYTHAHADHVHGIDDMRGINRVTHQNLDFYCGAKTAQYIKHNFSYLLSKPNIIHDVVRMPSMVPNIIKSNHEFSIKGLTIMPIKILGHCPESLGYIFDQGKVVYIPDFKEIAESAFKHITERPKLLILPLTTPFGQVTHAGLDDVLRVIERVNPEKAVINHMASECDYDWVNSVTPDNVEAAYDGMEICLE